MRFCWGLDIMCGYENSRIKWLSWPSAWRLTGLDLPVPLQYLSVQQSRLYLCTYCRSLQVSSTLKYRWVGDFVYIYPYFRAACGCSFKTFDCIWNQCLTRDLNASSHRNIGTFGPVCYWIRTACKKVLDHHCLGFKVSIFIHRHLFPMRLTVENDFVASGFLTPFFTLVNNAETKTFSSI